MPLSEVEQIKKLVEEKKNILITFRQNAKGDAVASAIALLLFLEKLGKDVDVISEGFKLPKQMKFLKKSDLIRKNFSHLQKFVITVDAKKAGVKELSYDLKDEKLRIFITPEQNFLTKEDVRTAQSDFKYDLIFVIDTQELESLGRLYDQNTELFYKKPIVNIDHSTANEHFGNINMVDITATSTAEILFNTLQKWQEENIDKDVAAALLTGMIFNTNSFKASNVKPQTLTTASKLIHLGADRDNIVKNLYRTRSLPTLKLWGQALSHLQYDNSIGLVWTSITRDDFTRSGAHAHDLYDIVDELIGNSPEAKLILLLHEHSSGEENPRIHVILDTSKDFDARELLKPYTPVTGNRKQATCIVAGKKLKEVENEIVNHIRKVTKKN